MGSTYLQLTNGVLRRLNEVELTSTNFASARGIHAAAKEAVLKTVRRINMQKHEWPFNKAIGTQILTTGTEEYAWPADFKIADWESFYIENDGTLATQTTTLTQMSKEDYWAYRRNLDLDAGAEGIGLPKYVSEASGGGFVVTPSPDAAYTVKFIYFINTVDLVTYDDVCTVPSEYDYVIESGAMQIMYTFLDNSTRSQEMDNFYREGLANMAYILIPKTPSMTDTRVNYGGGAYYSGHGGYYWGEL